MKLNPTPVTTPIAEQDWLTFPGGELEGRRPRALCPRCLETLQAGVKRSGTSICFECYRVDQRRERALSEAANLDTASEARFQTTLPFEPVNQARLARLKAARAMARVETRSGVGQYVDRRRQAQIAARHALQRLAEGLRSRQVAKVDQDRAMAAAFHAAEMQLPDAWLPFVAAR